MRISALFSLAMEATTDIGYWLCTGLLLDWRIVQQKQALSTHDSMISNMVSRFEKETESIRHRLVE